MAILSNPEIPLSVKPPALMNLADVFSEQRKNAAFGLQQQQAATTTLPAMADAAKSFGAVDVGGGQNAAQVMLGALGGGGGAAGGVAPGSGAQPA